MVLKVTSDMIRYNTNIQSLVKNFLSLGCAFLFAVNLPGFLSYYALRDTKVYFLSY